MAIKLKKFSNNSEIISKVNDQIKELEGYAKEPIEEFFKSTKAYKDRIDSPGAKKAYKEQIQDIKNEIEKLKEFTKILGSIKIGDHISFSEDSMFRMPSNSGIVTKFHPSSAAVEVKLDRDNGSLSSFTNFMIHNLSTIKKLK